MYSISSAGFVSNVRLFGASAASSVTGINRRGGVLLGPRAGGFISTASIPDGARAPDAYVMGVSDGGLAGHTSARATSSSSISASGLLASSISGVATTSASPNIGRQISGSAAGAASSSAALSAIGRLFSAIKIGATPSTIDIADAVWSRAMSPFTTIGTFGYKLSNLSGGGGGGGGGATAAEIADAVWTWVTRTLTSSGDPTKEQIAAQVRTELAVELGRIDAAITSRLAAAGYTAPDNSSITAIKAKTDNLPSDPADQSLIVAAIAGIPAAPSAASVASAVRTELATELARLDAAISSRLATAGYTAPDNSGISAIKTKTDQITFTSGNVNAIAQVVSDKTGYALTSGERTAIATAVEAALINEADGQEIVNAIVTAIGNTNLDEVALVAAIRSDIERSNGMLASTKANTDLIPGLF
jgi:hypothetical protein